MNRPLHIALALAAMLALLGPASVGWAAPHAPSLPRIERRVPNHPVSILSGCQPQELTMIRAQIFAAIQRGAPIYNDGDFRGCYETYERAARQIEGGLGPRCGGPRRALEAGRQRASGLSHDAERAWAMRDAFDGLILVIERSTRAPGR